MINTNELSRLQRLQQSASQKNHQDLSFQVQQDELQARADLLETQSALSKAKQRLDKLKSAKVLSFPDIIQAQNEVSGYLDGEIAIRRLMKELFPG